MLKQKTVYFREEDIPKWELIENKAEFLHQALKAGSASAQVLQKHSDEGRLLEAIYPVIKTPQETPEAIKSISTDWKPCKHNMDPKLCKYAKPGKPCK